MSYKQRKIKEAFINAKRISLSDFPRLVIMSDCHRGDGSWSDGFLPNRPLYTAALRYYFQRGFAYIELGDGDELWENRNFASIYEIHREVYSIFLDFQEEDRLFMIFGNHDRIKENAAYTSLSMSTPIPFYESIVVETAEDTKDIYMFHGYQGDMLNDNFWKLSRWLVRYLWRPLELSGFKDPTSAAKNYKKNRAAAARFEEFSKGNDCILIAGHTHKPRLPLPGDSLYFNSGSCVHPNTVTALEIVDGMLSLVKWSTCSRDDMSLYVCKEVVGEQLITDY